MVTFKNRAQKSMILVFNNMVSDETGDDCISIGPGYSDADIDSVTCGL